MSALSLTMAEHSENRLTLRFQPVGAVGTCDGIKRTGRVIVRLVKRDRDVPDGLREGAREGEQRGREESGELHRHGVGYGQPRGAWDSGRGSVLFYASAKADLGREVSHGHGVCRQRRRDAY